MEPSDLEAVIDREMAWAERAWQEGREGRARVCARRAAGYAVRFYFLQTEKQEFARDALLALKKLAGREDIPPDIRLLAARLVAKEKDPLDRTTQPVDDAWRLIRYFFPTRPDGSPWIK